MDVEQLKPIVEIAVKAAVELIPVAIMAAPVIFQVIDRIKSDRAQSVVKLAGMVAANVTAQKLIASKDAKSDGGSLITPKEWADALLAGSAAAEKVLAEHQAKVTDVYKTKDNVDSSVASIRDANIPKVLAVHGLQLDRSSGTISAQTVVPPEETK